MSAQETESHNAKLAKLQYAIKENLICSGINFDWILERVAEINSSILPTENFRLNCSNLLGFTALHFAYEEDKDATFNILLQRGADFTAQGEQKKTVLHHIFYSIYDDSPDLETIRTTFKNAFVNSILSAHVTFNNFSNPCDSNGISHFHVACMANHTESVHLFINNGTSVNQTVNLNSSVLPGYSPLHFAAKCQNLEIINILLKHNVKKDLKDARSMTAWDVLIEENIRFIDFINKKSMFPTEIENNEKIIEYFITNNILNPNLSHLHAASVITDTSVIDNILRQDKNLNCSLPVESATWPGYTPLHFAIQCNIESAKLLLQKGVNIEAKDANGVTPLDYCLKKKDYKAKEIYLLLSSHPVWKNMYLSNRKTKLIDLIEAMNNQDDFYEFLENINLNINELSIPSSSRSLWPGSTILHLAVMFSENFITNSYRIKEKTSIGFQIVETCLKKGADITVLNACGQSALHLAYRLGRMNLVHLLLQYHRESHNQVDKDGLSHLHIACKFGYLDVVDELLSDTMNVNAVYQGSSTVSSIRVGWTPLHIAIFHNNFEVAKELLKHGADIYITDIHGMTPIHMVQPYKESTEIASILLSSVNLRNCVSNIGISHLHIASFANDLVTVKKLIQLGANVNQAVSYQQMENNCTEFSYLSKYNGFTPLHFAMENDCQQEIFEILLEHGAHIFTKKPIHSNFFYDESDSLYHKRIQSIIHLLEDNENLQDRLKAEIGLTMLHIACYQRNLKLVEELLNKGANVNVQVDLLSPIWPGCTPLHVLLKSERLTDDASEDACDICLLLLQKGVDVTLLNSRQESSLHIAYEKFFYRPTIQINFSRATLLLQKLNNCTLNPVDRYGLSHFHIACSMNNPVIVEEFLKQGVDVNQPIHFYSIMDKAGSSPLHLAVRSAATEFINASDQVKTISILLKYGADFHAEDLYGDTPLHDCANFYSPDRNLFKILIKAGSSVNAKNIKGQTPLEILMHKKTGSSKIVQYFYKYGYHFNSFNPVTEKGCLALMLHLPSTDFVQNFVSKKVHEFPDLVVDEVGRTIINNIVSETVAPSHFLFPCQYAKLIEEISRNVCDIDDQDNLGRTALHMAALFRNHLAAAGLLMAGANINIVDAKGKTAFGYIFEPCSRCNVMLENDDDEDEEEHEQYDHMELFDVFVTHVKKLQICGLEVSQQNKDYLVDARQYFISGVFETDDLFNEELKDAKAMKVDPLSFSLGKFLSETNGVAEYVFMLESSRIAIDNFFRPGTDSQLFKEFSEITGLLKLQYRKAVMRVQIIGEANDSLAVLVGFRMPYLCSRNIFEFLANTDLKNLIASVIEE